MCCHPHIIHQILIFSVQLQHAHSSTIAVLPDYPVTLRIFSEFVNPRSQNKQFSAICHSHPRAVDCFVSQPCTAEFSGIQIYHAFSDPCLHKINILLLRKSHSPFQNRSFSSNKKSMGTDLIFGCRCHGQYKYNIFIKYFSYRCMIFAHHPFHSVYSADHMCPVDHLAATHTDKNIFCMVRHADNLMRHYLSDR